MNHRATDRSIFKKVAVSEKKMLFREIALEHVPLYLKGDIDDIFHLVANRNEKDDDLYCRHTEDSQQVSKSQRVMVNFHFRTERYFFQTVLRIEQNTPVLKIGGDIFQLQRRHNARIDLPEAFGALLILQNHGGRNYFLDCYVKDISAGGIKIELPAAQPELKMEDKIKGSLRLGSRRPMELEFEVRFVQSKEENGKVTQTAGLKILNIDQVLENKLLIVIMDVQREIFLKHS